MRVEILIDGRAAIPVRAIPFITGWMMSPDMVAASLARTDTTQKLISLSAYQVQNDGHVSVILPKEWDCVEASLKILSDKLSANEDIEDGSYPEWRIQSIPQLPPGVFVWKDEFEASFSHAYSKYQRILLDEREGDRDLNFTPMIPTGLQDLVSEGFVSQIEPDTSEKMDSTDRSYYSERLAILNQAATKFWKNADRKDRDTHPDNETVTQWLVSKGYSGSLASKAATIIRPEWVPTGRKPEEQ